MEKNMSDAIDGLSAWSEYTDNLAVDTLAVALGLTGQRDGAVIYAELYKKCPTRYNLSSPPEMRGRGKLGPSGVVGDNADYSETNKLLQCKELLAAISSNIEAIYGILIDRT